MSNFPSGSGNPYQSSSYGLLAAEADTDARAGFIKRTYAHLTGAVVALIALETALFSLVPEATMGRLVQTMLSGYGWLIVIGAFMAVSWMARSWASSDASRGMQYAGLGLYVLAEAVILLPMLYLAISVVGDPKLPIFAGGITLAAFAGLTAFVFITGVDLTGWGKYLGLAGLVAIGAVVCGILFGFSLGLWFSAALVALACGYILYDTSNIIHQYRTDQHVAAALALFGSVALLFYYVLHIMLASRD